METFILHYTPLVERKQNILAQLSKFGMEATFVEQHDREVLTENERNGFDTSKLKLSEISCSLKHFEAFANIRSPYALILEDDVILDENFKTKLEEYIRQLPEDFDMLFIGDGCGLHIPKHVTRNSTTNVYLKDNFPSKGGGRGATRCTDSYVLTKKCAQTFLKLKHRNVRIDKPMGWWMNVMIRNHSMKIYWAEPTIVTQGSQTGKFLSTIQN